MGKPSKTVWLEVLRIVGSAIISVLTTLGILG